MTKNELLLAVRDFDDNAELFVIQENSDDRKPYPVEDIEITRRTCSGQVKISFCFRKGAWDD